MNKQQKPAMRFARDMTLVFWIIASLLLFAATSSGGREVFRPDKNTWAVAGFPGDVLQIANQQPLSPNQANRSDPPAEDDGQKNDAEDDESEDDEWEDDEWEA